MRSCFRDFKSAPRLCRPAHHVPMISMMSVLQCICHIHLLSSDNSLPVTETLCSNTRIYDSVCTGCDCSQATRCNDTLKAEFDLLDFSSSLLHLFAAFAKQISSFNSIQLNSLIDIIYFHCYLCIPCVSLPLVLGLCGMSELGIICMHFSTPLPHSCPRNTSTGSLNGR